jgi:hypothetical protein
VSARLLPRAADGADGLVEPVLVTEEVGSEA